MNRFFACFALAAVAATAVSAAGNSTSTTRRLLVRVREDVLDTLESAILPQLETFAQNNNEVLSLYNTLKGVAFSGIAIEVSEALELFLKSQAWVETCESDMYIYGLQGGTSPSSSPPPPPKFIEKDAPKHLDEIDNRGGDTDGKFEASQTGSGIDIYILDSGINQSHEEFTGRIVDCVNFDLSAATNDCSDCNGHGTHVSALAAGTKYGAAKNASIIAVRVYGCDNEGPVSQVIAGINYVLARMRTSGRRSVVNMSFGGNRIPALDRAVQVLVDAGAVVVVAAGNENVDSCNTSPGGAPAALTVAAAESKGSFASFSNYGSCVALAAPGVNIKSAWIGSSSSTETLSGTSMASPITAGVVALYLEAKPGADVGQVKNDIVCSATTGFLKNIPTSSTPDRFIYSPPGGFVSGCVTSGAKAFSSPYGLLVELLKASFNYRESSLGRSALEFGSTVMTITSIAVGGMLALAWIA